MNNRVPAVCLARNEQVMDSRSFDFAQDKLCRNDNIKN